MFYFFIFALSQKIKIKNIICYGFKLLNFKNKSKQTYTSTFFKKNVLKVFQIYFFRKLDKKLGIFQKFGKNFLDIYFLQVLQKL